MVQTIITHQCQQATIQVSCRLNPDFGSSDDQSDLAMVHGLAVAQNIIQEYNRNKNLSVRGATIIFFRRDILRHFIHFKCSSFHVNDCSMPKILCLLKLSSHLLPKT